MSNPSRQHSKVLYHRKGLEKRKDRKTRKSRSKEKVVSFSSAFLFPARKRRQSPRVKTLNQGDIPAPWVLLRIRWFHPG